MKDRSDFQPEVKPSGDSRMARMFSLSLSDYAALAQRHKRLMALCFFGIMAGAILATVVMPPKYKSEGRFLIQRDRLDPVTTSASTAPVVFKDTVTEEELNSETEIMLSDEVLRTVVVENNLQNHKSLAAMLMGRVPSEDEKIAKAAKRLRGDLDVAPIKKTNLISVAYTSTDPKQAQQVLASLDKAYLAKHILVHRSAGQSDFFKQQMEQAQAKMDSAEAQLKAFSASSDGVSPAMARDLSLQKLNDFQATLETTRTSIQETQQRIADLNRQSSSTPNRITTQEKKGQNAVLLENLKSTLLTLELKRTELLTKFQPTYRPVLEVDKQIADTRDKIEQEEKTRVQEVTTDQSPTFAWIDSEKAKANADLEGLKAREAALRGVVGKYTTDTQKLDVKGLDQQELLRQSKEAEQNLALLQTKYQESLISDAMDQGKLLNVSVAIEPRVPVLPVMPAYVFLLAGLVFALAGAAVAAMTAEYFDPSFHTPAQVTAELNVPVLAAVPFRNDPEYAEKRRASSSAIR